MIWGGINFGTGGELDSLNEAREDCDKMAKKYAPKIFEKHEVTEDVYYSSAFQKMLDDIGRIIAEEVAKENGLSRSKVEPFARLALNGEVAKLFEQKQKAEAAAKAEAEKKRQDAQKAKKEALEKEKQEANRQIDAAKRNAEAEEKRRKEAQIRKKNSASKKTTSSFDDEYED